MSLLCKHRHTPLFSGGTDSISGQAIALVTLKLMYYPSIKDFLIRQIGSQCQIVTRKTAAANVVTSYGHNKIVYGESRLFRC